jgi:hypothetical protein
MLLQEDIELIKQGGMKQALYAEVLQYLKLASDKMHSAQCNSKFESEIDAAIEAIKVAKQLYLEWVKVSEIKFGS